MASRTFAMIRTRSPAGRGFGRMTRRVEVDTSISGSRHNAGEAITVIFIGHLASAIPRGFG